jgi:hypothetical protein
VRVLRLWPFHCCLKAKIGATQPCQFSIGSTIEGLSAANNVQGGVEFRFRLTSSQRAVGRQVVSAALTSARSKLSRQTQHHFERNGPGHRRITAISRLPAGLRLKSRGTSQSERNCFAALLVVVPLTSGGTMRIAQVAPLAESVPPKLYGGTERVVFWLTRSWLAWGMTSRFSRLVIL